MFRRIREKDRRAAVVVLVAVTGTLMAGFAALTIDLGNLYMARGELQRVADAAATAGTSIYLSDDGLAQDTAAMTAGALSRGDSIARQNPVLGSGITLTSGDVHLGRHDFSHPTGALSSTYPWNAVQVTAARSSSNSNGSVALYFAKLWGRGSMGVSATARAAFDDRMGAYKLAGNTSGMGFMPFTIPVEGYYDMISHSGHDQYSYSNGAVTRGGDNIREVMMYPWKWQYLHCCGGSGNFGILMLNRANKGASALSSQISRGGASVSDVQIALHTSTLTFYDATHTDSPRTYSCGGDPGMKTSIQKALSDQIGNVFGFFLNNGVCGNGSNATYSICGIFFARIMDVDISGGPHACGLIVQPVGYTDSWIVTSSYAPTTYGTVGRLMLVQ